LADVGSDGSSITFDLIFGVSQKDDIAAAPDAERRGPEVYRPEVSSDERSGIPKG